MKDPIQQAQQRALQYSFVDGSMEFFLGGLCLLLGLYFYAHASLSQESLLFNLLDAGLVLLIIGGVYLARPLLRRFKERITYPRSGYVAYRREYGLKRGLRMVLSGGVGMLVSLMMTLLFTNARLGAIWMPVITGMVFSLVLLIFAYRSGLLRMYLLALAAAAIGGGLMYANLDEMQGLAAFYSLMAAALLLSGGLTLWRYLRSTPLAEEQDE